MRQLIAGLCLAEACFSSPASARVERIEIVSRQSFAAGTAFGDAGASSQKRPTPWRSTLLTTLALSLRPTWEI
jgi:hypothetical protein